MKTALRRQQTEVSGVRPAPRTPQSESRLAHSSFPSRHPSSVSGPPSSVLRPSLRGFTMVEIAISLAVIGFALVAIVGILPIGMGVQKENRQETIINQDATVFLDAIRNGAMGLDDLTNYIINITNWATDYQDSPRGPTQLGLPKIYWYTKAPSCPYPINNGMRIIGLLSTPKYVPLPIAKGSTGFTSNHVVALVYSMSGPASEKFPQNNPAMQNLTFSYRLHVKNLAGKPDIVLAKYKT